MLHFLGIGAQKAGTTWLYFNLVKHPGIFLTAEKELHFWDRHRNLGLDWYRAQFAPAPADRKAGEITPAYGILASDVIAEVRREFPDVRLIYLMRNPIERAWSSALMALPRAEMTIEEASDTWFIDHFNAAGSMQRGDYESCLRAWRAEFPEDRIHIELFDDILSDPRAVLKRCAVHIGVDPSVFDQIPEADLRAPHNTGLGHPVRPTLRRYLDRLYRPKIERLARYIGRELSGWLEPVPPAGAVEKVRLLLATAAHRQR